MHAKDWLRFYQGPDAPQGPSPFALFLSGFMLEDMPRTTTIVDVGCGNGRDTHHFLSMGFRCAGVDPSGVGIQVPVQEYDITEDIVYSRFFLHSVSDEVAFDLVARTPRYFVAECRTTEDRPTLYPEHDRHLVDPKWLAGILLDAGFVIMHMRTGYGMSMYKGEDPHLVRVVACRA